MSRLSRAHVGRRPTGTDETLVLEPDEAHYVRRVLRSRAGDALTVFDGRGGEWSGVIERCDGRTVVVRIERELSSASEPRHVVRLYQGLCRPERLDWLLQKVTELGAAAVTFVAARRSESRRPPDQRRSRWERIALEACRQCGRSVVPRVDLADSLPQASGATGGAWLLDPGTEDASLVAALAAAPAGELWLAVGPESGWAAAERAQALDDGWTPASLGPRTLRTETAGVVAVALALAARGDL